MTKRQLESRRNAFQKAGLDPQLYDRLMGIFGRHIIAKEPGAKQYVDDPSKLKEVYVAMNEVWEEAVLKPEQIAQEAIPYEELYALPGYLTALLECWHNWTLKSAAATISFVRQHPELQRETLLVCDGFGASSIMYAMAFPEVKVRCHIMGDVPFGLCEGIVQEMNLPNLELTREAGSSPIVVAFECFEHFYDPVKFAAPILARANMICHSSPWRVPAHGHFERYFMNGAEVHRSEMPRLFGKWLKSLGFESSVKTFNFRFFNGDPEMYFRDLQQPTLPHAV